MHRNVRQGVSRNLTCISKSVYSIANNGKLLLEKVNVWGHPYSMHISTCLSFPVYHPVLDGAFCGVEVDGNLGDGLA